MLNYLEYLLRDYNNLPATMKNLRVLFLTDDDSPGLIINTILDTELKSYILPLVNYKLEKTPNLSGKIDIVYLDNVLSPFISQAVFPTELQNIILKHYNPVWRVAAFFCGFLLKAHKIYNEQS